jgi:hypothetical protein
METREAFLLQNDNVLLLLCEKRCNGGSDRSADDDEDIAF